jgi:arabinose operon protein AraL
VPDVPAGAPPKPLGRPVRGVLLDLDGTVYLGESLIPGAGEAIRALKGAGVQVVYLTNKPLQPRDAYAEKLTRLGLPTTPREVVTSSSVLTGWLRRHAPEATLFVIGEPPLQAELRAAGFALSDDPQQVDVVVAAFDRGFDYRKLTIGMRAIRHGARFVATNPDRTCPLPGGEVPDCAAVIGALEGCTGKQVEVVAGKPSPVMLEIALGVLGLGAGDCLMAGDRLETDILMANRAGVRSALVLSGVTRSADLREAGAPPGPPSGAPRPDDVLDSLADLPALLGIVAPPTS